MSKVTIITIGNEILNGKTLDTNAYWMSNVLDQSGFYVTKKISVGDTGDQIRKSLDEASDNGEIILITGGLGPTRDDVTKKTLAEYFNSELVLHEESYRRLVSFFRKRGFKMNELNRQQAILPDKCTVIPNQYGTAPAMWFEKEDRVFISMPGVPHEMKNLMSAEIIPRLIEKFHPKPIIHKTVHTAGIGESWLAEKIKEWDMQLPDFMSVAYLPQLGLVSLRITARGRDKATLENSIRKAIDELKSYAGEYIFGFDEDNLQSVIGSLLNKNGQTLSVAESCTGGHISHTVTSVPGSSAYFKGGIVAYSNKAKQDLLNVKKDTLEKFGAVSEQTVCEMAEGARMIFRTDYALATSGIAGPDGGTPEKPVGMVCIGISDEKGTVASTLNFTKDRMTNISYTTNRALTILWERMKMKNGHLI